MQKCTGTTLESIYNSKFISKVVYYNEISQTMVFFKVKRRIKKVLKEHYIIRAKNGMIKTFLLQTKLQVKVTATKKTER